MLSLWRRISILKIFGFQFKHKPPTKKIIIIYFLLQITWSLSIIFLNVFRVYSVYGIYIMWTSLLITYIYILLLYLFLKLILPFFSYFLYFFLLMAFLFRSTQLISFPSKMTFLKTVQKHPMLLLLSIILLCGLSSFQ